MAFRWAHRRQEAAQLVAEGQMNYPEIAERVGVTRKTIHAWRARPEFRARVAELEAEIGAAVRQIGIARVEKRVAFQNERWVRMRRIIEARAADPAMAKVPGGTTGLLMRTVKRVVVEHEGRSGEGLSRSQEVEEFTLDAGLLKEIRELEKLTAEELGQRVERSQVGLSGDLAVYAEFERAADLVYGEADPMAAGEGPGGPGAAG